MKTKTVTALCCMALLSGLLAGCGHTSTAKIGLLSIGDLEGRTIPDVVEGPTLTGEDACKMGGDPYYLSTAVQKALARTSYDTLVDVEVTTKTGLAVWDNKVIVRGTALDSRTLAKTGGAQ